MARKEQLDLTREASAALVEARSAEDVRRVWRRYYPRLGHRALGRLVLGRTPDAAARFDAHNERAQMEALHSSQDGPGAAAERDNFASWPHAFTLKEALSFSDSEVTHAELRRGLLEDQRFVRLGSGASDEEYMVPRDALLKWFCGLSYRLAQAKQATLDERQFALAISSLRQRGRWDAPPREAVELGTNLGFCGPAYARARYVFPVARILSFVPAGTARRVLRSSEAPAKPVGRDESPEVLLSEAIKRGLSGLPRRQAQVVRAREGLTADRAQTLQQIGDEVGVTRERVRQLEEQAWKKIHHASRKAVFARGLLGYVMLRHGSQLVETNHAGRSLISFACKAAGVPEAKLPNCGLTVLGASQEDVDGLESVCLFPEAMDAEVLASRLDSRSGLSLLATDLAAVSRRIAGTHRNNLTKTQKVYLALREIAKPAHFSAIAEMYNRMFPEDSTNEGYVCSILAEEKYGVVWIRLRGTYALREWGWERPPLGLFDTVTRIVRDRYEATRKPVPFAVVAAEIGRFRRAVNWNSVTIAAHCNPALQRVSRDCFIPRASDQEHGEELAAAELNQLLQAFEASLGAQMDPQEDS